MKILSIGNSFSEDAHKWLHKLAECNGQDLETYNLNISGCSLEKHWTTVVDNCADYGVDYNGDRVEQKTSIAEALKLQEWDVITLQQVSSASGMFETYEPYLSSLVSVIREACPTAKLYFHQTWAYEIESTHSRFVNYHNDQREMFECIVDAGKKAAQLMDGLVIPSGTVIQKIRETVPEFDYKNGGLSLCRDTYHLSLDYGRFTAAAVWLRTLTGIEVKVTDFEDFEPALMQKILDIVNEI